MNLKRKLLLYNTRQFKLYWNTQTIAYQYLHLQVKEMGFKVIQFTAKLKKIVMQSLFFSLSVYTQSSLCYVCTLAPSVPADIKAVISSIKTIVVSWLPPIHSNGKLTGYILYISILSGHKDVSLILYTFSNLF